MNCSVALTVDISDVDSSSSNNNNNDNSSNDNNRGLSVTVKHRPVIDDRKPYNVWSTSSINPNTSAACWLLRNRYGTYRPMMWGVLLA